MHGTPPAPADSHKGDLTSEHRLPATPETTVVGVIDAATPPVLTIASGDEVVLSTWTAWGGEISSTTTVEDVLALRAKHVGRGARGPHTLTGPIAVTGARPGDVLRVDVLELVTARHGFNMFPPGRTGRGVLPERFPEGRIQHFELDAETMTTTLAPGIELPLRPFLGIMGVAPAADGPHGSDHPGPFGGNIDLRHLVEGTTLRLPVFRDGAGFYAGDAHACQGDGEVDLMALETAMTRARLRLTVERGRSLRLPRAETPTHLIVLAFHADLDEAARIAVDEAVTLIHEEGALEPEAAYTACALAVDLAVTQLVNEIKGIHALIPKWLLASG